MVQHPLKSAGVLVASCSEPEHQRDVICLLGLCGLPRFQLETVSEADGAGAGAERKQHLVLWVPPAPGDKGPWPHAEKVLFQRAYVCPSLGHRMEAPSSGSEEDLGALLWAGFFETTSGWQQECAAHKPQQVSQTTTQNLVLVIMSLFRVGWILKRGCRCLLFVPQFPRGLEVTLGSSCVPAGAGGCPSLGRNTFFPPCVLLL